MRAVQRIHDTVLAICNILVARVLLQWALPALLFQVRIPSIIIIRLGYLKFNLQDSPVIFLTHTCSSQDINGSANYNFATFQGVAFAFPIAHDYGIVFSLELAPVSNVRYGINNDPTTDTSQISYYGRGGLNTLSAGLSFSPFPSLQTGIKFNYIYGRIEQYQNIALTDSGYSSDQLDRSAYYQGVNFTFGLLYHGFQDLFDRPSLAPLTFGFIFSNASTFNVEEDRLYTNIDTTSTNSGTSTFPYTLGFGLSYTWKDQYLLTGDVVFQNWGSTKYLDANRVEELSDGLFAIIQNATRAGLGLEISPPHDAYYSNMIYRVGCYLQFHVL